MFLYIKPNYDYSVSVPLINYGDPRRRRENFLFDSSLCVLKVVTNMIWSDLNMVILILPG